MRDDELISAYADGVAELTADERKRVESLLAADPARRGEVEHARGLLRDLRAMPQTGTEPDWQAMERAIRAAVPDKAPSSPRRWLRWFVPACAAVAAAIVLVVILPRDDAHTDAFTSTGPTVTPDVRVVDPVIEQHTFVYLDGEAIDLGAADADQIAGALSDDDTSDDDLADGTLLGSDLGWVDDLDGDKLDRVEKLLKGT